MVHYYWCICNANVDDNGDMIGSISIQKILQMNWIKKRFNYLMKDKSDIFIQK